ncbi:hypothetical protein G9A89_002143 [Geosiphon pyriformis]|nr:hypothetical protein G9A89_002143 [Geosiphon pyriformis]
MIHSMKTPNILTLLLFITLLSIFNENTLAYQNFSYTETETGKIGIYPGDTGSFDDGTIMFRLAKTGKNENCTDPKLRIRLIRPDGKVVLIALDFPIPEFNFCQDILPSGMNIVILPMTRNQRILVAYFESKDLKLFQRKGLILNFEGTIQGDPIDLSPLLPPTENQFLYTIHPNKSLGWIFANSYSKMRKVVWTQFTDPDTNGKVKILRNRTLNLDHLQARIFCTPDGSYGLAYTRNNTHNTTNLSNKLNLRSSSHVTFLRPESKNFEGEFTLWQTSMPLDSFEIYSCFFDRFIVGTAYCILKVQVKSEGQNSKKPLIFLKISFLSTGATYGVTNLSQVVKNNLEPYYILSLENGGYLYIIGIPNSSFISFNVYDQNLKLNATSQDIFPNLDISVAGSYLQRNNTLWFLSITDHTWTVSSASLPKFLN